MPIDARHPLWSLFLADCRGYRVHDSEGKLGFVEDVIFDSDARAPAALAVRGGVLGRSVSVVPVREIVDIDPRRQRLRVRGAGSSA